MSDKPIDLDAICKCEAMLRQTDAEVAEVAARFGDLVRAGWEQHFRNGALIEQIKREAHAPFKDKQ